MKPGEPNRRSNLWTARIVPVLLLGIIGYTSWVVTSQICVKYLLNPAHTLLERRETAAAVIILVFYYLLLLLLLICYARLIQTVATNPGYVPRGPQYYIEKQRKIHKKKGVDISDSGNDDLYDYEKLTQKGRNRVGDFWQNEVFVCSYDGRPNFCATCYNFKPDRGHHCRELDRCVYKMDHFCPWVGGIISETSFKYFIQFTFWAALFCLDTMVVTAYYFARRRREENFLNVHWVLALALAVLFFLFSAGMFGSSLQFAFINSTTIENLNRKTKVWYLAVYIPEEILHRIQLSRRDDLRMITYPRPPSEQLELLQQNRAKANRDPNRTPKTSSSDDTRMTEPTQTFEATSFPVHPAVSANRTTDSSSAAQTNITGTISTRTFAILETKPGANPFDIGAANNFREVMGYTLLDWLFPIHPSPLVRHNAPKSLYRVGLVVYKLRKEAGILSEHDKRRLSSRKRRRRTRSQRNNPEVPTSRGS